MASKTFYIGGNRVRISTIKEKRPTGLAGIAWRGHNNAHVNIKIGNIVYGNAGGIAVTKGGFYWYIRSDQYWCHRNTANNPVATFDIAFNELVDYVKVELDATHSDHI